MSKDRIKDPFAEAAAKSMLYGCLAPVVIFVVAVMILAGSAYGCWALWRTLS